MKLATASFSSAWAFALVGMVWACSAGDFTGAGKTSAIKKDQTPHNKLGVPINETKDIPADAGSGCKSEDESIAVVVGDKVQGKKLGDTVLDCSGRQVKVEVYDPNNGIPPGIDDGGEDAVVDNTPQNLGVPVNQTRVIPTDAGGGCKSKDDTIAKVTGTTVFGYKKGKVLLDCKNHQVNVDVYVVSEGVPPGFEDQPGSLAVTPGQTVVPGTTPVNPLPSNPNDDLLTNGGDSSVSLVESMTLTQLFENAVDAADDFSVTVTKLDANGTAVAPSQRVEFKRKSVGTQIITNLCQKSGPTYLSVEFLDSDGKLMRPGMMSKARLFETSQLQVAKTGGGDNNPEVTVNDGDENDGCIGSCIDRPNDNTFRFSCPKSAVNIKNL